MSISTAFQEAANNNGGDTLRFTQKRGLTQLGLTQNKGVCQALSFFDGLLALSGAAVERTKRKDVLEYAVHFQQDFQALSDSQMWDVKDIRAKYIECLGYMEFQNMISIGYVDVVSGVGGLTAFLNNKSGHFNLLSPTHVTGYYCEGAAARYYDPNCGTASFNTRLNATGFITEYHGCDEFRNGYKTGRGDMIVVQMLRR